jgi:hypothetical protein
MHRHNLRNASSPCFEEAVSLRERERERVVNEGEREKELQLKRVNAIKEPVGYAVAGRYAVARGGEIHRG